MPVLMERDICEPEISTQSVLDQFLESISTSSESALLLDFDGTLAPFRIDPASVRPWAGIARLLDNIQAHGHTRLAIISGRPALQVKSQLDLKILPEIWGLHGAERLLPDGTLELEQLLPNQQQALTEARQAIRAAHLGVREEEKWNAVVVHWRGKTPHAAEIAHHKSIELLRPFTNTPGISLLQFDGGTELRAGRNKGDAVRLLLRSIPSHAPVAYLGDDTTDEDAFKALAGRGLSVLVRREWRPGAAKLWLRPPAELRAFLRRWLQAAS